MVCVVAVFLYFLDIQAPDLHLYLMAAGLGGDQMGGTLEGVFLAIVVVIRKDGSGHKFVHCLVLFCQWPARKGPAARPWHSPGLQNAITDSG